MKFHKYSFDNRMRQIHMKFLIPVILTLKLALKIIVKIKISDQIFWSISGFSLHVIRLFY